MKTSMAWKDFRHSNLVATSVSVQGGDDSDGAEEDGFVGTTSKGPEDMMMEIMDKYVHAGEALAERENDVRHLSKQVKAVRADNKELEAEVARLTTSNEKLADDEGRWYSLARELENQMEVIKKGETYTLFQDKVDEAEARLEVATDANSTCRKRLFEIYGEISPDFQDKTNDGSDEDVDEHRQHATVLDQLRRLKSATKEMEDAFAAAQDTNSAAKLVKEQAQAQEAQVRNRLEAQVSELREEIATRDAKSQSEQNALRDASAKQAQELRQAFDELSNCRAACATAQATAQAGEDARRAAVEIATTIEAKLEGVQEDLRLTQEENRTVTGHLTEARAALETSQREAKRRHEAQDVAENSVQQLSGRVVELETLLQDTRVQASQVERDLASSSQKITELTQVAHVYRGEVAEATTDLGELRAHADAQERLLQESMQKVTELTEDLHTLRGQLAERDAAATRAESDAERALHGTSLATEEAEGLREEVERLTVEALTMKQEYAEQAEDFGDKIKRVTADASREHAARAQELRDELAITKQEAVSAAEESTAQAEELRRKLESVNASAALATQENTVRVQALRLRQELELANAAVLTARDNTTDIEGLRQELERANAAVLAAQDNTTDIEGLRRDLNVANSALSRAQDDITRVNEARIAAETDAEKAESAKVRAEKAWEESRQQGAELTNDVRALEAQLCEAKASATQLEAVIEEHQEKLSSLNANQLEERTIAVARAREEWAAEAAAAAAGAPAPPPVVAAPVLSVNGDTCADVLFGSPALGSNGDASTGGKEASAMANGVAAVSRSAEAEQLQAHADAMELELRYTLESFEGQLSAMAREKVAIQKQVKELTGQCTTLRKQVSHYKKVAKESEAQGEQDEVIELRARLVEAEDILVVKSQELAAKAQEAVSATALTNTLEHRIQEADSEVLGLRESLESASQELAAKAQEVVSATALANTLEHRIQEAESETLGLRESFELTSQELAAKAQEAVSATALANTLEHRIQEAESETLGLRESLESTSQEMSAKAHEAVSARALADTLEHRIQEVESEVLGLQNSLESTSQELSAKAQEVVSARALADTLERRIKEVESEVLGSQKAPESTAEELASARASASDLQCALSKISELQSVVGHLEREKIHLNETTAALTSEFGQASAKLLELQDVIHSQQEEKAIALQTVDQTEEARTALVVALRDIAELIGCDRVGEAAVSSLSILDKIAVVKRQLATAEDVLEATAQALRQTAVEGEVALGWSWIINGVSSLQRRLQVAELELSRSAVVQDDGGLGDTAQVVESASVVGECNGNSVRHEALRQAKEEVETVKATLRKERLLMLAFRRWGHFYLALSNEALRKRTKEQNQARIQKGKPESASSSVMEQTRTDRGRSRRRGNGREQLQLSTSEVRLMVEKEAETVARELASAPTASLLALVDARKEMDDVAMKAQATLGVLYAQPPLTQDANVATDGTMMLEIEQLPHEENLKGEIQDTNVAKDGTMVLEIEQVRHEEKLNGETQKTSPSPGRQTSASVDMNVDAGVGEEALPGPPIAPTVPIDQQKAEAAKATDSTGSRVLKNAPSCRTTGPLVEDGVSKKDRAEYLKKQREERKANRKKGMQASTSRTRSADPPGSAAFRNRRTSAPAMMPTAAVNAPAAPRTPPTLHGETDLFQASPKPAIEDREGSESKRMPPPPMGLTAGVSPTGAAPVGEDQQGGGPSPRSDSTLTGETMAPVRAPPPRMFNPTAVPPPIAPSSATTSSHAPPPMHPTMAFNVNESVERALKEARGDAGRAERNAMFWKYRFRDLAVWAASFAVLTYASDHGFEDC
ncbi:unnamed protein product [Ectocarpus sp. 6 AP-2014]